MKRDLILSDTQAYCGEMTDAIEFRDPAKSRRRIAVPADVDWTGN